MKYNLSIIFIIIVFLANTQTTKKALFLGNSYTYYNGGLPTMIKNIAQANGDILIHDKNTPGGYTLNGHSTNATSLSKIQSNDWDFVVLQGQSQMPSFPPSQVATDVKPYAVILNDSIKSNNSCTKTMFFMTWGKKNGDPGNCPNYPPLCTFEGITQRLRESYLEMTVENNADCAPVGVAWKKTKENFPSIELFATDGSHPSVAGTYLSACVFYSSMFGKTTIGNTYWSSLDSLTAFRLQSIASSTVLDSLSVWSIEINPTEFYETDSVLFSCDSVQLNNVWYNTSTTFSDTITTVGACADIINFDIQIGAEIIDSTIVTCDSLEINSIWYFSDISFIDTIIGNPCNQYISYHVFISNSVVIDNFSQAILLKTNTQGINMIFDASNFDTLRIYNNDTIVYFTTTNDLGLIYYCKNNFESLDFILEVKNNCSIDSISRTFYCSGFDAIKSLQSSIWRIYPNPSNDFINISSETLTEFSVRLYDISGKELILNSNILNKKIQLDISIFEHGIYYLVLYNKNGIAIGQKKIFIN